MFRRMWILVLVVALGACGGGGKSDEPAPTAAPERHTGGLPWPLGDRQADRIDEAGLPKLKAEGSKVHYHAHLDVFVDGETALVPANIGIDLDEEVISPLHTHTPSGILHVEANEDAQFTLDHVLTEWGVSSDLPLKVYVNGDEVATGLDTVIRPNAQIAMVFGTPPAEIPSTYDCTRSPTDSCDKIPQPRIGP
ncbi:MAG: hypothetical protein Q8K63_06790 [Acidimicrobiales bacterium]|nr:hypothetical protein [Acidimicrobiales bacterium]